MDIGQYKTLGMILNGQMIMDNTKPYRHHPYVQAALYLDGELCQIKRMKSKPCTASIVQWASEN